MLIKQTLFVKKTVQLRQHFLNYETLIKSLFHKHILLILKKCAGSEKKISVTFCYDSWCKAFGLIEPGGAGI